MDLGEPPPSRPGRAYEPSATRSPADADPRTARFGAKPHRREGGAQVRDDDIFEIEDNDGNNANNANNA